MSYEDEILRPPEELIATGDPNLDGDKYDGDEDPMITDDGYGVITPNFDEVSMLNALENPGPDESSLSLSPQEAYNEMKYMAPLSDGEKYILDTTPFLDDTLSWIDDPGHDDELFEYQGQKSKAMDNILDDQMYGDDEFGLRGESEENRLIRTGNDGFDDSGWGLRSVGRLAKKVGSKAYNISSKAFLPVAITKWSLGKFKSVARALANIGAWPIKRAIRPAIYKTADNIARKNGRTQRNHADMATANKAVIYTLLHSKNPMLKLAGETLKHLGTGVSGTGAGLQPWDYDTMGNPALIALAGGVAVAITASIYAIIKASSAHAGASPDPNADPNADPSADPNTDPNTDPNAMPPDMDPSMQEQYPDLSAQPPAAYPGDAMPYDQSGKLYRSIVDPLADMNGPDGGRKARVIGGPYGVGRTIVVGDSLGAVATAVLGEERRTTDEIADDKKKSKRKADLLKLTKAANAGDLQASALVEMFAAAEDAKERALAKSDWNDERDVKVATLAVKAKTGDKKAQATMNGIAAANKDREIATSLGIDPFLYKLNPAYWLKNSRQRRFIDAEKQAEQDASDQAKYLKKRSADLKYGEQAAAAKQKADDITKQNWAAEARLKELEGSLTGDSTMGALVSAAVGKMQRNSKFASYFANKITSGQALDVDDVKAFKQLLSSHDKLHKFAKKVTGVDVAGVGYHERPEPKSDLIGETAQEILGEDRAEILGAGAAKTKVPKAKAPPKIDKKTWAQMAALGATDPKKLNAMAAQNGIVMTPTQKKYLKSMVLLTRQQLGKTMIRNGVPAAAVQGDFLGSWGGFAKAVGRTTWAAATLPFTAAAFSYHQIKNAAFPGSSPPNNPVVAANARRLAALQRRQKALAAMQVAQSQYDAQQAAAQAEQDATEQEQATADAQQAAQEEQYATPDNEPGDSAGVGASAVEDKIRGSFTGEWVEGIADPKIKAIVKKAGETSVIGSKIRSGARIYSAAMRGDAKAKKAIKNVSAKAKKGNLQAKADYHAIKAGKIAVDARVAAKKKGKITSHHGRPTKALARRKDPSKFQVKQRTVENKIGDRLAQASRARRLAKASKVELRAARGHKKSQKIIARIQTKAKKGDKRAKGDLAALKLAQHVRKNAPSTAERKRVMKAAKVVRGAQKGKKKDLRQIAVVNAAAKQGQPNGKRALKRLKLGALVTGAIVTGKVVIPKKKPKHVATAEKKKKYEFLKGRVTSGIASKEEAFAASKEASDLGLKKEAADLSMKAKDLPSSADVLKNAGTVARASQGGNEKANEVVKTTLEKAAAGDPTGITGAGKLAGVQAIDTVNKGGTMSPEMAEATALVQRSRANDPEAQKIIKNVGEQVSANPTPEAVQAAIAISAAGIVLSALAAKPNAMKEWNEKAAEARGESYKGEEAKQAGQDLKEIEAKVRSGTATASEAAQGKKLAVALGKPQIAAQISVLMPPDDDLTSFSTLPDATLAPITDGWKGLLKESLRALLLATRDPVQNYREGVSSRSKTPLLIAPTAPVVKRA